MKVKNIILLLLLVFSAFGLQAQSKKTYSKEKAAELKQLMAAVERNPDSMELNWKFIGTWGVGDSTLVLQYRRWMNRFPKSYIIPFAIGKALSLSESPDAREFLLKVAELKPDLAAAWQLLADDAWMRNDSLKVQAYLEKAVKLEPQNPDYAFAYAGTFKKTDPALYRSLYLDIVKKFPTSQRGAQALYWLALNEKDEKQKIAYYELLNEKYANSHVDGNRWYVYGMEEYFNHLLFINPPKALEVARRQNQPARVTLANAVIKATNLLDANKPDSANALIQQVQVRDADLVEPLLLLKSKVADEAHHTWTAYDSLTRYYSKQPGDTVQKMMFYYGSKLGFTNEQIDARIAGLRDSTAKIATDFSLYNYLTGTNVSLANYRGKVILLTYWFPGCGPCRAEFPHFESVIKKINNKDLVYIGINTTPSQSDFVIPLLKSTGYTFIPLKDVDNRNKGTLPSPYAPANYLIDQRGRIIYTDFMINERNERMLELMIMELLKPVDTTRPAVLTDSTKIK
jgi:thiol-disulfide isomerase/thioredoxin